MHLTLPRWAARLSNLVIRDHAGPSDSCLGPLSGLRPCLGGEGRHHSRPRVRPASPMSGPAAVTGGGVFLLVRCLFLLLWRARDPSPGTEWVSPDRFQVGLT